MPGRERKGEKIKIKFQKAREDDRKNSRQGNGKDRKGRVEFLPSLVRGPHLEVVVLRVLGMTGVWQLYGGLCPCELWVISGRAKLSGPKQPTESLMLCGPKRLWAPLKPCGPLRPLGPLKLFDHLWFQKPDSDHCCHPLLHPDASPTSTERKLNINR